MPKQNRVKNLFKSITSLAPEQSSHAQSQLSHAQAQVSSSSSDRVSSRHTHPVIPSSSSDGVSSHNVIASSSSDGVPSQPTRRRRVTDDAESEPRGWVVDVIDECQVTKSIRLKVQDVHNLENGSRIIVECDEFDQLIGKSAGILAGFWGELATNSRYFPIGFESWSLMPKPFVHRVVNDFILPRFFFRSDQQKVKGWLNNSLNKKWKEFRLKLWYAANDPLLGKEEIIKNVPEGIPMDQWALYVNYRSKEETKELCLRNQRIRGQQTLPHTSGAMSLARRRDLMEKIEEIRRQRPETRAEISPNDALGVVFGPEHPGRVRGLGMGAVPTVVFKQTSRRGGCSYMSAASTSAPPPQWVQEMTNMRSQLNALTSLFLMKIKNIPEEFAHLFPTPSQAPNLRDSIGDGIGDGVGDGIGDGVTSPTGPRRSFDGSNYENGANNN